MSERSRCTVRSGGPGRPEPGKQRWSQRTIVVLPACLRSRLLLPGGRELYGIGLRVASSAAVPEPGGLLVWGFLAGMGLLYGRRGHACPLFLWPLLSCPNCRDHEATWEQFRSNSMEPPSGLTAALTSASMPDLTLSGSVPQRASISGTILSALIGPIFPHIDSKFDGLAAVGFGHGNQLRRPPCCRLSENSVDF